VVQAVRTGLEVLLSEGHPELDGRTIGLVTNPTGVDRQFRSSVDLLHESPRVDLVALFGPEHGVRGVAQAGARVGFGIDARTGLPAHSLYGETKRPMPEMLAGIDVMVVDIQDVGVRYYTYLSTLVEVQQAAHEAGIRVAVLDRPNPLADLAMEGNLLQPGFRSFAGAYDVPIRHGMTLGELAQLIASERGWAAPIVVPVEGWSRTTWYDETDLPWVLPSPNLPTLDAVTLYAGTCLIEGTTLSEGRGTTRPFELIGAPGLDGEALARDLRARELPGFAFRPAAFVPTFSKHHGQICTGIQVYLTDRVTANASAFGIHLLEAVRRLTPSFGWAAPGDDDRSYYVDLLLGGSETRAMLDAGAAATDIIATWSGVAERFAERRAPHLLY